MPGPDCANDESRHRRFLPTGPAPSPLRRRRCRSVVLRRRRRPGNRRWWASSGSAAGGRRPAQPPAGPATQQARLRRASGPTAGGRQCHHLLACPYGTDAIGHSHPSNSAHPRQKTGLCVFTAKSRAHGSISVAVAGLSDSNNASNLGLHIYVKR